MKQIRIGTFETNSSSTHSLVIASGAEWASFKNGSLVYDKYGEKLRAKPEESDVDAEDFLSYNDFLKLEYETFEKSYKTEFGEELVVFGYYGYDG